MKKVRLILSALTIITVLCGSLQTAAEEPDRNITENSADISESSTGSSEETVPKTDESPIIREGKVFTAGGDKYIISDRAWNLYVMMSKEDSEINPKRIDPVGKWDTEFCGDFLWYEGKLYLTEERNSEDVICYDPLTEETELIISGNGNTSFIGILDHKMLVLSGSSYEEYGDLIVYDMETEEQYVWHERVVQAGIIGNRVYYELFMQDDPDEEKKARALMLSEIDEIGTKTVHPLLGRLKGPFICDNNDIYCVINDEDESAPEGNKVIRHIHPDAETGKLKNRNIGRFGPNEKVEFIGIAEGVPYFIYYKDGDDRGTLNTYIDDGENRGSITHNLTKGRMDVIQPVFTDKGAYVYDKENRYIFRINPGPGEDTFILELPEGAELADIDQENIYYYLDRKTYMTPIPDTEIETKTEKDGTGKAKTEKVATASEILELLQGYPVDSAFGISLLSDLSENSILREFVENVADGRNISLDLTLPEEDMQVTVKAKFDPTKRKFEAELSAGDGEATQNLSLVLDNNGFRISSPDEGSDNSTPFSGDADSENRMMTIMDLLDYAYEITVEEGDLTYKHYFGGGLYEEDTADTIYHARYTWDQVNELFDRGLDILIYIYKTYRGDDLSSYKRPLVEMIPELAPMEGQDGQIDFYFEDGKIKEIRGSIRRNVDSICPRNAEGELLDATEIDYGRLKTVEESVDNVNIHIYIRDILPDEKARELMDIPEYEKYLNSWIFFSKCIEGHTEDTYTTMRAGKYHDGEDIIADLNISRGQNFSSVHYIFNRILSNDEKTKYRMKILKEDRSLAEIELTEKEWKSNELTFDIVLNTMPNVTDQKMTGTVRVSVDH